MKLLSHVIVFASESKTVGCRPLGRSQSYCRTSVNAKHKVCFSNLNVMLFFKCIYCCSSEVEICTYSMLCISVYFFLSTSIFCFIWERDPHFGFEKGQELHSYATWIRRFYVTISASIAPSYYFLFF